MTRVQLFTDGGARGNPGPAGIGFVIVSDGTIVCEGGAYVGEDTNNVAEYRALIWGIRNVVALGQRAVDIKADSELVVKQVTGAYRVKQEHLKPLAAEVRSLLAGLDWSIAHVRREQNKEADRLVNEALDTRSNVGTPACGVDEEAPGQGSLF